jgi:hypothetical protein
MSDPFFPPNGRPAVTPEEARQNTDTIKNYYQDKVQAIREENERVQEFKDQFGVNYSLDQLRVINQMYDDGAINDDQVYELFSARAITDNLRRQEIDIRAYP